jgi:hypothetical protein
MRKLTRLRDRQTIFGVRHDADFDGKWGGGDPTTTADTHQFELNRD